MHMRNTLRLLVLALVAGPALAPADKKTDDNFLEMQRDLSSLDEKIKAVLASQKSQDEKLEALRVLVQQAAAASSQVAQDMAALQRNLTSALTTGLNDQQGKISMAVAPLGSQMDALAQSVNALTQTVSQMNGRMGSMDGRVKDLSDKVSLLNQPAPAPPPAAVDPNGATSGGSRLSLRQDAERDYSSGYDDQAKTEFSNYIKTYPQDEYAPTAGYFIGMLFLKEKNYDDAVQAFQDVIDHYQGNNKAQDALYQQAVALESGGHKKEAIAAFNQFLMLYSANDYAPQAKKELAKLTAAPANNKNKAKGAPK